MFGIFKRKYPKNVDLSGIAVDMHSHLLPGIDDGSPDPEESEVLIAGLQELGYRKFICTPHIMWDLYKNDPARIQGALHLLQNHLKTVGREVELAAAAEYYMDEYFTDLLTEKASLLTVTDKRVLVEFSFVNAPINMKESLFQLQLNGYKPILAHPERYNYLSANRQIYAELKEAGCLFQVNLLSFTGYYGKPATELASYLLKQNYVELLGTDLHHQRHLHVLRKSPQIMTPINQLLDSGKLLNPSL